jgi:glycosyltransferase involved in cell wall biosynthesis
MEIVLIKVVSVHNLSICSSGELGCIKVYKVESKNVYLNNFQDSRFENKASLDNLGIQIGVSNCEISNSSFANSFLLHSSIFDNTLIESILDNYPIVIINTHDLYFDSTFLCDIINLPINSLIFTSDQESVFACSFDNFRSFLLITEEFFKGIDKFKFISMRVLYSDLFFCHHLLSNNDFEVKTVNQFLPSIQSGSDFIEVLEIVANSQINFGEAINYSTMSHFVLHVLGCPFCLNFLFSIIVKRRPDLTEFFRSSDKELSLVNWLIDHGIKELNYNFLKPKHISFLKNSVHQLPGVNVISYFSSQLGLSDAANNFSDMLTNLNIPITKFNLFSKSQRRSSDDTSFEKWHDLTSQHDFKSITIFVIGLDSISEIRSMYPLVFLASKKVGAFIYWELEYLTDKMINSLVDFDFFIVPNQNLKVILEKYFHKSIFVFPSSLPSQNLLPSFVNQSKTFEFEYFLAVFDFNSDMFRKNVFATIDCFRLFQLKNNSSIKLIIKAINGNTQAVHKNLLLSYLKNDTSILFYDESWSKDKFANVMKNSVAFISLHRSEGFGLNIFDAMRNGVPSLVTNYGGNLEYMSDYPLLVDFNLIGLNNSIFQDSFYQQRFLSMFNEPANVYWANPDIKHAAALLTKLSSDTDFYNYTINQGLLAIEKYVSKSLTSLDKLTEFMNEADQIVKPNSYFKRFLNSLFMN